MGIFSDGKISVEVSAESENENVKNVVAQHPIQRGDPMADHTQKESMTWSFEGKIYGENQHEVDGKYSKFLVWQEQGQLLTYSGAIRNNNIIIEELSKTYDDGGFQNAIKINFTLRKVNIVESSFVKKKHVGPKPPAKTQGVYVTVRPGNTYWGWMVAYGTSIQTLRNWNHWPDRRIPIGARARVK